MRTHEIQSTRHLACCCVAFDVAVHQSSRSTNQDRHPKRSSDPEVGSAIHHAAAGSQTIFLLDVVARVNITSAVNAGANELEVTVVNLWPNRLIGDASLPAKERFTETNMRKFTSKSPLLPSGLLGPVTILTKE